MVSFDEFQSEFMGSTIYNWDVRGYHGYITVHVGIGKPSPFMSLQFRLGIYDDSPDMSYPSYEAVNH